MTQKPRKRDFGELKSKTFPWGACPQTSLELGNRSLFILDPRLSPVATTKNREDLTFTANIKILIDTIKRQLAVAGVVLNLNCFVSLSTIQNPRKVL